MSHVQDFQGEDGDDVLLDGELVGLGRRQVWPLGRFFCFLLLSENSLICLEGKSMTPRRGNTIRFRSSQQLPRLRLGPSTRLVRCFPELQRYKDTVRCNALGAEVPGHRQQQLTQTLIVRLLKTQFFTWILDCEKSTE